MQKTAVNKNPEPLNVLEWQILILNIYQLWFHVKSETEKFCNFCTVVNLLWLVLVNQVVSILGTEDWQLITEWNLIPQMRHSWSRHRCHLYINIPMKEHPENSEINEKFWKLRKIFSHQENESRFWSVSVNCNQG